MPAPPVTADTWGSKFSILIIIWLYHSPIGKHQQIKRFHFVQSKKIPGTFESVPGNFASYPRIAGGVWFSPRPPELPEGALVSSGSVAGGFVAGGFVAGGSVGAGFWLLP